DVVCLGPDALLTRRTHSGTIRGGGGPYERVFLWLRVFGPDGLVSRVEFFDADREDEALARFDALTAPVRAADGGGRRRVRPNAATANAARVNASFAARDAEAYLALFAEGAKSVHHPTGAFYDARGSMRTWRSLLSAEHPTFHSEPLATLGASL